MSVDPNAVIASLPPDLQAAIQAMITAEVNKNLPPPPKELSPAEKAALYLSQAAAQLRGENMSMAPGEVYLHDRLISLLALIVDVVYPVTDTTAEAVLVSSEADAASTGVA